MFDPSRILELAGKIHGWLSRIDSRRLHLRQEPLRGMRIEELEDRVVPSLMGKQLFPPDNPWNQNISNAPVAANSAAIIAHIGSSTSLHPDWGADNPANGSSPLYGIPFNIVHGNNTAKVNVTIDNYPGESDITPVPIPANAVIEGDFQNGPNPNGGGYNSGQRGDSHLIVWDEDNNVAYELYGVTRPSDATLFPNTSNVELPHTDALWHAAQETVWDMKTDTFRTLGATSADAAGLSILSGLVRPDEGLTVAQGGQGVINHALRFTLPIGDVNPQYIYPASHIVNGSQGASNLPFGGRLRMKNTPAVNALIGNMPPESQIIARAMQQYGLILADIGSAMFVSGASATTNTVDLPNSNLTWDLNDIFASNGLKALNAGDFEVVDLRPVVTGLSTTSGSAGIAITITGQNFSGAAGHLSVFFGSTAATSVSFVDDSHLSVVVPNGSGTVNVTVQSGVVATDDISSNPLANVNAPIFGYGMSATTSADLFNFGAAAAPKESIVGRVLSTGQWWAGISTGLSFNNSLRASWAPSVTWVDVQSGDFNGDGLADMVGRDPATGNWWVGLSTGSTFTTSLWGNWSPAASWVDVHVGDFTGDGKADIVGRYAQTGQWWLARSTGSSFTNSLWATWSANVTWVDVKVGDFSGDGKADIAGRYLQGGSWWVGVSTGSSFTTSMWTSWNPNVTWVDVNVGDFNGDGKADIVGRYAQTGQWWTAQSTGSSFANSLWTTWSTAASWVDVQVGDFNGDGKTDIIGRVLQTGQWWTAQSTGSSFANSLWATWSSAVNWVDVQVGDFNGDKKADIIGRVLQTGQWWAGISTGANFTTSLWTTWSAGVTWVDVHAAVYA